MDSTSFPQTLNTFNQPSTVAGCICSNCNTTQTPLWRRGDNDELLCNACGLYYRAKGKHRQIVSKPRKLANPSKKHQRDSPCSGTCPGNGHCNGTGGTASCQGCPAFNQRARPNYVCANCSATTTPLWRRDLQGNPICNACGLYSKMHGKPRPVSARRNTIKRRVRLLDQVEHLEHTPSAPRDLSEESDFSTDSYSSKRPRLAAKLHPKVGTTVRRKEMVTIYSRPPQPSSATPTWLDLVNDALLKNDTGLTISKSSSDFTPRPRVRHNSFAAPSPASHSGAFISPASFALSSSTHSRSASLSFSESSPSLLDYEPLPQPSQPVSASEALPLDIDSIQKEISRIDELRYRYTQMLSYLDHRAN